MAHAVPGCSLSAGRKRGARPLDKGDGMTTNGKEATPAPTGSVVEKSSTRGRFLRALGLAAGAAVAGRLTAAETADAADGGNTVLGQANTSSHQTSVTMTVERHTGRGGAQRSDGPRQRGRPLRRHRPGRRVDDGRRHRERRRRLGRRADRPREPAGVPAAGPVGRARHLRHRRRRRRLGGEQRPPGSASTATPTTPTTASASTARPTARTGTGVFALALAGAGGVGIDACGKVNGGVVQPAPTPRSGSSRARTAGPPTDRL